MPDYPPIATLLPHAGAMCLIDTVVSHDACRIHCRSHSHRAGHNPLRHHDRLSMGAGIEYAAQAMAIHGGLGRTAGTETAPRAGYIAVLSQVHWTAGTLDAAADPLDIHAEKITDTADGFCYRFALEAAGQPLLAGEMIVALLPAGSPLPGAAH